MNLKVGSKAIGVGQKHTFAVRDDDGMVYGLFFTESVARLFAAAPDLLEACERAKLTIENASFDRYAGAALEPAYKQILDAISKVEGKGGKS